MALRDLILERPAPELKAWAIMGPRGLLVGTAGSRRQAISDLARDFGKPWPELKCLYRPVKVLVKVIPG